MSSRFLRFSVKNVLAISAIPVVAVSLVDLNNKSNKKLRLPVAFCNTPPSPSPSIDKVKKAIADAIEEEDGKREDGSSIGPTLIRLAWHASGTYSIHDKTGGSNGSTMRMEPESKWGANAGLANARAFLEPIAKKYSLSQADTWTLAGATAIEVMGGIVL